MPLLYLAQPTPINLLQVPASTWTPIVPTGVPGWATGVAIFYFCHAGTASTVAVRPTGSSDIWGQTTGAQSASTGQMYYAGLGNGSSLTNVAGGGSFDLWTSTDNVNVQAWIVAAVDWTFLLAGVTLAALSVGSYGSISASSAVPAGAQACIFAGNKSWGGWGCRATGSTDDWTTGNAGSGMAINNIVALDSSLNFSAKSNATSGATPIVTGYIPASYAGFTWNQNAVSFNRTPGSTGSLQALTTETNGGTYLYACSPGTSTDTYQFQPSSNSNGLPSHQTGFGSAGQFLVGGGTPYCNINASDANLYEQAWFSNAVPISYA